MIALSHQEQTAYFEAFHRGYRVLDVPTVAEILAVSAVRSRQLLRNLSLKGAASRVGRGKYALVSPNVVATQTAPIDPYLILDELMESLGLAERYYVAYASALALHHAAEQIPQELTVAVTERRFPRRIGAMNLRFPLVTENRLFGRVYMPYRDARIWASDPEKTLLDCLDRPTLAGGIDEVARAIRTLWPRLDQSRLLGYVVQFGNASLAQRLGHLLDALGLNDVSPELRQGLQALRGKTAVPLVPASAGIGAVDHVWRVKVNAALDAEVLA